MKIKYDTNGNKTLSISKHDLAGARGFSIQTLGNLPETHRNGVGKWTMFELKSYISKHGTSLQRSALGVDAHFQFKRIVTHDVVDFDKKEEFQLRCTDTYMSGWPKNVEINRGGGWQPTPNINHAFRLMKATTYYDYEGKLITGEKQ